MPKRVAKLVRCLGPGPEHSFVSHDPLRQRICRRCKNNSHHPRGFIGPSFADKKNVLDGGRT